MRPVLEFLFPKYLARLSYFFRMLLCNGTMFYLYGDEWGGTPAGIGSMIALLLYMSIFVLLPRIRDIGLSAGWMVLAFIPYISSALGVILLFRRTNPANNPLFHRPPGGATPAQPATPPPL